jgi:hypothetical protein
VIWFGEQQSSLRITLIEYLPGHDIILILFSSKEHLWQWLNLNSSLMVASLILQSTINNQEIIAQSDSYDSIQSILIRCVTDELITLQRFSRTYNKVDGIFNDDERLLIKLAIDLTLFSEELGDQQREDENNEMEAQRNYDRALKLCVLVKKI